MDFLSPDISLDGKLLRDFDAQMSVIYNQNFHQNCQTVETIFSFDIFPHTVGIIRGKRERANKIVLCVRCLLSGYVKGWLDITDVLFSGLKEDWLSKIKRLR